MIKSVRAGALSALACLTLAGCTVNFGSSSSESPETNQVNINARFVADVRANSEYPDDTDDGLAAYGRGVCDAFSQGKAIRDMSADVVQSGVMTVDQISTLITYAFFDLCPEYKDRAAAELDGG